MVSKVCLICWRASTRRKEDKSRGSEIQHWWNSFGKLYKDYIIIDDRTDFFDYQKSKLIQVNPQVGFTDLNLLDAVYLLN